MAKRTLADLLLEQVGTNDVTGAGAEDGGKNQDAPKADVNDVTDADPNAKKKKDDDGPETLNLYHDETDLKDFSNTNFEVKVESLLGSRCAKGGKKAVKPAVKKPGKPKAR